MRCILFLESKFESFFKDLCDFSIAEIDLLRIYDVDGQAKDCMGFNMTSLSEIASTPKFDIAIILSSQVVHLKNIINALAGDRANSIQIIDIYSNTDIIFDGNGKMMWLKHIVELQQKKPDPAIATIGDFSYYTDPIFMREPNIPAKLRVGKFCSIGPNNLFLIGEEHQKSRNTTYPFDELGGMDFVQNEKSIFSKGDIVIGNDVWSGANVTILSGVEVGDGCIIGTGSVISKNIAPYSIVVGNPGKVVGQRFSDKKINMLLEMKWWDWDYHHIYDAKNLIQSDDTESLYDYYLKNVKY